MRFDEIFALGSSVFVVCAIVDAAGRHGGVRASLRFLFETVRRHDLRGWQVTLLGLLLPQTLLVTYYLALILNPHFRADIAMREAVIRSVIIFTNLILGIYFMEGTWFALLDKLVRLWKSYHTRLE